MTDRRALDQGVLYRKVKDDIQNLFVGYSVNLREELGLTRDEERHLEILGLFRTAGHEGCDKVFAGPRERTCRARTEAREFGWCGKCRRRAARAGRADCLGCAKQAASCARGVGRESHLKAMRKSNAKIRDRLRRLGICTSCRKLSARTGRVDCQVCTDRAEQRRQARRAQLRAQTGVTA